jgi:hypothetical protein
MVDSTGKSDSRGGFADISGIRVGFDASAIVERQDC